MSRSMSRRLRCILMLAVLCPIAVPQSRPATASDGIARWMPDRELRETFGGRTIDGTYANGLTFTERYLANGRLDYIEPQRRLDGRWSVVEGSFCTIYDSTPTGGCYRVRRESDNCYTFYFAAVDEEEAAEGLSDRPSWTARAWVTDRPSTCRSIPSV